MNLIQEVPHEPLKPVSVEREAGDRLVIEGVIYPGEIFRLAPGDLISKSPSGRLFVLK